MLSLEAIKAGATMVIGRGGLILKKVSPEIMLVAGIGGGIAAGVMACKATFKFEEVKAANAETFKKIETVYAEFQVVKQQADEAGVAITAEYTEEDYKHDLRLATGQSVMRFIKLYGPSVGLGIVSIGLILGSYGIMRNRMIGMAAAYKIVDEAFKKYRQRVRAELGEAKDREFRFGDLSGNLVDETPPWETGDDKKEGAVIVSPKFGQSEYARWFDSSSPNWQKNPEYNLFFLKNQETYANHRLQAYGHVFLNEVYDSLGLPRTRAGQLVGWVKGQGDDFITFNIYSPENEGKRDFVNGYNPAILLDFNVDGNIYDKI